MTVSFGVGIGPLYLAGVALLVMAGQVLRARRQRPTQERESLLIGVSVTGRGV